MELYSSQLMIIYKQVKKMEAETLWYIIESSVSMVALLTMITFMVTRNIRQYKNDGQWSWARFIMVLSFSSSIPNHFITFGYYALGLENFAPLLDLRIFIVTVIMFSTMFAVYINGWDSLLLLPLFVMIGAVIYTHVVGLIDLEFYYMVTFGILSLVALWEVGIRLRDNMALGIGIMSTLKLFSLFGGFWLTGIIGLVSIAFGAITIGGLFRPFKTAVISEEV